MKGCGAEYDQEDNLIWRGLRLRIGMSWGMVSNQKPLNTGRADYFGMLANGAARVMALATPGQVSMHHSFEQSMLMIGVHDKLWRVMERHCSVLHACTHVSPVPCSHSMQLQHASELVWLAAWLLLASSEAMRVKQCASMHNHCRLVTIQRDAAVACVWVVAGSG